jgi:cob(I)alamin adenosyltransferase
MYHRIFYIHSETKKKKQVQDVTDLVQRLETTLENAIAEKQNEEERIVSAYIKELEKCINAWDKNSGIVESSVNNMTLTIALLYI